MTPVITVQGRMSLGETRENVLIGLHRHTTTITITNTVASYFQRIIIIFNIIFACHKKTTLIHYYNRSNLKPSAGADKQSDGPYILYS